MFIFHAINNDLADLFTVEGEHQIHHQNHRDHDQNQLSAENKPQMHKINQQERTK